MIELVIDFPAKPNIMYIRRTYNERHPTRYLHIHIPLDSSLVKISNEEQTKIESMAEDRSVILAGNTNSKVNEFDGVFGMSNLDKLASLEMSEYKKGRKNRS